MPYGIYLNPREREFLQRRKESNMSDDTRHYNEILDDLKTRETQLIKELKEGQEELYKIQHLLDNANPSRKFRDFDPEAGPLGVSSKGR